MRAKDRELKGYLDREDMTMEELIAVAHGLLGELVPKQSRYKVTERPDARTIRYYINEHLLPRPESYEGGRARYSGSHLIRLLLIKKLQAEHHSLRRIANVLEGATDLEVLRELLPAGSALPSVVSAKPPMPTESQSMLRFPLAHGGSVDVPADVARDPVRRRELAERLETLARKLRIAEGEDEF
jgi:DNA-binding transcriptional MerR regulator